MWDTPAKRRGRERARRRRPRGPAAPRWRDRSVEALLQRAEQLCALVLVLVLGDELRVEGGLQRAQTVLEAGGTGGGLRLCGRWLLHLPLRRRIALRGWIALLRRVAG